VAAGCVLRRNTRRARLTTSARPSDWGFTGALARRSGLSLGGELLRQGTVGRDSQTHATQLPAQHAPILLKRIQANRPRARV
jgi:hypothetical protein